MENIELIERAKIYLKLLGDGVHPVTGKEVPSDSAFVDEKVKRCFDFISQILDEYVKLSAKVEKLQSEKEKNTVIIQKKKEFSITEEQRDSIKLSKEPLTIVSFMRNINSVVDTNTTEKLSSTRINKWLCNRGFVSSSTVKAMINRTVYKPSEFANRLGIVEEEFVDKKSGEMKSQIKLEESAQLFIIENIDEIISTT